MTYEEKFNLLLSDPKFLSDINFIKSSWGFNQHKYQSIADLIKDERKLGEMQKPSKAFLQKEKEWPYRFDEFGTLVRLTDKRYLEFLDALQDLVDKYSLPFRCTLMAIDYMLTGKIKKEYPRVWMRVKTNIHQKHYTGEIELHLAADAAIRDIKKLWPTIVRIQKGWNRKNKVNQKIRKFSVFESIMRPALAGKKANIIQLQEMMIGSRFYKIGQGDEFKETGRKARARVRSYRSRYKRDLKRHTPRAQIA